MSDYIGGGVTLLLIVAAIVGVLFLGGKGDGAGEPSIIPEAVAAAPAGADYPWKAADPSQYDEREFFEYN